MAWGKSGIHADGKEHDWKITPGWGAAADHFGCILRIQWKLSGGSFPCRCQWQLFKRYRLQKAGTESEGKYVVSGRYDKSEYGGWICTSESGRNECCQCIRTFEWWFRYRACNCSRYDTGPYFRDCKFFYRNARCRGISCGQGQQRDPCKQGFRSDFQDTGGRRTECVL